MTGDRGASWAFAFAVPGKHIGNILFAGDLTNPVTYVPLEEGSGAKLTRASTVSGTPVLRSADSTGMGTISLLNTGQALYAVAAVDPKNPDRLLAHDMFAGTKASRDGGLTWFRVPPLDTAVSDTGRFVQSMNSVPFVTAIAFDPTNSCHILVGTMQNGVIRSADGGLTWRQVRGSRRATIVSSFFFPPTGVIWMSTYGRGLWQVNVDRAPPASGRCDFPQPPGGVVQPTPPVVILRTGAAPRPFAGLQDSVVCPKCTLFLVHEGWITDVEGDGEVGSVATTSGGQVEQRQRDGREASATVANRVRDDESDGLRKRVGKALTNEQHVRALVVEGTRLVAYIVGSSPLAIAPSRTATVFARALAEDSVHVQGFQFLPGAKDRGVTVVVAGDTLAAGVTVGADGRFDTRLRVRPRPGWVVLTAVQRDGLRVTRATTNLQVVDDR